MAELEVFTTCPPSSQADGAAAYVERVVEIAQWSEAAGCRGILVYTDNSLVDPWALGQVIVEATSELRPLIAVQPAYMHPYAAAKKVASIAYLHRRPVDLNYVAGGFRNDLLGLGDDTEHGKRYDRLVEYASVVHALLDDSGPVTFEGQYYTLRNVRLTPRVPPELRPLAMVSGSSEAGRRAAKAIGAVAVKYPAPAAEEELNGDPSTRVGIRIGIVARETEEEAWRVARERFPPSRKGQITHALAMQVTDSRWHKQLSNVAAANDSDTYWLHPFANYQTFCPYLVGSYSRVAEEVGRYLRAGVSTVILDVPAARDDFDHIELVLSESRRLAHA